MRVGRALALLLVPACALACATAGAQTYTYTDLIRKLTDLQALALPPQPGVKCAQASSYDRASKYDEASGKYVAWDANGDGGGIIRREGGKVVMAEIEGPGIIWRSWSAMPAKGHVRVYLDGAAEPAIDLPFEQWFDGKHLPFNTPALVHDAASGKNCYVPIPFQKSCKITADPDWGAYYQFTYEALPKTAKVPTFKRTLTAEEMEALNAADLYLRDGLGADPAGVRKGERVLKSRVKAQPGKGVRLADIRGARAITALRIKVDLADRNDQIMALRELALKITFDGEKEPAVWSPLGDFFGTAPGANLYKSLPLGMTEEGYYSFWYMPFGKGARVEIVNDGPAARAITASITHAPLEKPANEYLRFHAKWHRDAYLPTEAERGIEWTMLKAEGKGRWCGVQLHVWNPRGGWWGEGDELFYVDGEKFPSTFGTGSEDYFGYAWCNPAVFYNAYHNQPFNSGNNRGHASVNRWQITDNVPFQTSFFGSIEKYFPNKLPQNHAATVYFYLAPGGTDPYQAVPLDQRLGYFDLTVPEPKKVKGATEGETIRIVERTAGKTEPQDMGGFGPDYSNDKQLWWTEAKPGDKLTVEVSAPKAGKYTLKANFTKAIDYGIMRFSMDGKPLGGEIDFFNEGVAPTGEQALGDVELTAGAHKFTVEIVGANAKAVKGYMFGLDYVLLEAK